MASIRRRRNGEGSTWMPLDLTQPITVDPLDFPGNRPLQCSPATLGSSLLRSARR